MKYQAHYTRPTGETHIVEPTRQGVAEAEAKKIAEESNTLYQPLKYFVKEMV
jgi:hypothetical protein